MDRRGSRRWFLGWGAGVGAVTLAGCLDGGDSGDGNATDGGTPDDGEDSADNGPNQTGSPATPTATETTPERRQVRWDVEQPFPAGEFASLDAVTPALGGYVLAGATGDGSRESSPWILRVEDGDRQRWSRVFSDRQGQFASVAPVADRGFVAAGAARTESEGTDALLTRVRPDGDPVWSRTHDAAGSESLARSIHAVEDGPGHAVAGTTLREAEADAWFLGVDDAGDRTLSRRFGAGIQAGFESLTPAHDGGFVLAGTQEDDAIGKSFGWAVRVDSEGRSQWTRVYGDPGSQFSAVERVPDGYLLAGHGSPDGGESDEGWILLVDRQGEPLWDRRVTAGGPRTQFTDGVAYDGGYLVVGGSLNAEGTPTALVVGTDSEGTERWRASPGGQLGLLSSVIVDDGAMVASGITGGRGGVAGLLLKGQP